MCLPIAVRFPESVLESGKHAGHEYVIVKNGIGYRCGYVKVEAGHPWHGKGYDDVSAEVHGGLTFAAPDEPCDKGGPDSGYWLGFDCGHAGDAKDPAIMTAEQIAWEEKLNREFFAKYPEHANLPERDTIKTTDYVRSECFRLCEQAAAAAA